MPPPGVQPAATRKSITDRLIAGAIPRAQARAAIESGEIDGAIDALMISLAPAAAPTIVAATVARPATPSGVVSTLGGAAPPAVAAPAPAGEIQARMDEDAADATNSGPPTPRSTRDAVGAVIAAVQGLAPPSSAEKRHARKSGRADDDDDTQAGASQIRSPLRRTAADDIRSPPRRRQREDGFSIGDRVVVCDDMEAPPEFFQGTITDRIDDDTYEVTLDNDEVWPSVGDDQISLL